MKIKLTLLTLVFAITFSSFAQPTFNPVEKGNKQAGISLMLAPTDMYWSETALSINKDQKIYGINLAGNYGWFIERGWLIGLQANIGAYHDEYDQENQWGYKENAFDFSIAPMTRYYFTVDRKHRFKPFLFAGMPIVYTQRETDYYNNNSTDFDEEYLELRGTFGGGVSYFGKAGSIEMNISNMGLFVGVNKFIQWKEKDKK
jgi:hypothetical protein